MARRKLNAFTADDANDSFTPTVKSLKAADVEEVVVEETENNPPAKPVEMSDACKETAKTEVGVDAAVKTADEDIPQAGDVAEIEVKEEVEEEPEETVEVEEKPRGQDRLVNKRVELEYRTEDSKSEAKKDTVVERVQERGGEQRVEKLVQLVGFMLGAEEYGVNIQSVQEINRTVEITRVPRTPDYVEGVVNLRGKVIPVVNLRKRFGLESIAHDKETRVVVMEIHEKIIGILVDAVSEVLRIPSSLIEPPPDIVTGVDSEYIEGVAKLQDRLLILLDLDKILLNEQLNRLEEVP